MKKFHITDEDGKEYSVEELENKSEVETETNDAEPLSDEEIAALRKLASVADKLVELANKPTTDEDESDKDKDVDVEDEDEDEDKDVDVEDEDEDEDKDVDVDTDDEDCEEIVDTDEDMDKVHDSKKSAASIKKRVKNTNDSVDMQSEIAESWAKRYGGKI